MAGFLHHKRDDRPDMDRTQPTTASRNYYIYFLIFNILHLPFVASLFIRFQQITHVGQYNYFITLH